MNLCQIKKGFAQFSEQSKFVEKCYERGRIGYFIDMVWCLLRYGAQPIDYTRFEFYKKSAHERNRYLTIFRYFKLMKQLQKELQTNISGNKINEYKVFKDFIKRDWMAVEKSTSNQDLIEFIKKYHTVIAKPNNGEQGKGVMKISEGDEKAIQELLRLKNNDTYVMEELLTNCNEIQAINDTSLNTVRVTTVIDKEGKTHIFSVILRVGIKGSNIDNWGAGGIGYNFDLETGVCNMYGKDKKNQCFVNHPISNVQMIGFKLPQFEELKGYIYNISKLVPEAKYTGWDIAITPKGFDLVEMNCPAGHDMFQSFDNPVYEYMKKIW